MAVMTRMHPDELRLALGLRGGVSLAVWIGGACAEIDAARRSSITHGSVAPDTFWGGLLELTNQEITVDILAGASAGGLNGVILAASQIYGFDMAAMKDVWLRLGQLHDMVRDGEPALSLLDGDGYFLKHLQAKLAELVSGGVTPEQRPRLDLFLTATLVEPIRRRLPSERDEELFEHRYSAGFHFLNLGDSPWLTDFGRLDEGRARTLWQLAIAGRSTSSFPGAFEAAAVWASRPAAFEDETIGAGMEAGTDLRDIFTESRGAMAAGSTPDDKDAFVVCDGGVLDNIPLGRAIQAITVAPADRPTRRVLVYVQPGVPTPTAPDRTSHETLEERRSTRNVLKSVYRSKVAEETIAEDLGSLERYNSDVVRAKSLREQTLGPIDRSELLKVAAERYSNYRSEAINAEVRELRRLLDDPVGAIGKDVFPLTVVTDAETFRSPLAYCSGAERTVLDVALRAAVDNTTPPVTEPIDDSAARVILLSGVAPLRRTALRLLSWARYVEANAADDEAQEHAGRAKQSLYQTLLTVDLVLDRARKFGWIALGHQRLSVPDPTGPRTIDVLRDAYEHIIRDLTGIYCVPEQLAHDVAKVLRTNDLTGGDGAPVNQLRSMLLAAIDTLVARKPLADGADGADVREVLLDDTILATALELSRIETSESAAGDDPARFLNRQLTDLVGLEALAALEIVDLPYALVGTGGDRPIEFVRMSAAPATPLAGAFTTLWAKVDQRYAKANRTPPQREPPPVMPGVPDWMTAAVLPGRLNSIPIEEKLAGNELANFSAFLRRDWRMNDWMWGRLDAVPTLVQLVATPNRIWAAARRVRSRLEPTSPGTSAEPNVTTMVRLELLKQLHDLVVGPDGNTDEPDPATSWARFYQLSLWDAVKADLDREVEAVAAASTQDTPTPGLSVTALNAVLTARRQWELVAGELGTSTPKETVERLNRYDVGSQTFREVFNDDDRDLVRHLTAATRSGVAFNLRATSAQKWVKPVSWPIDRLAALGVRAALTARDRYLIGVGAATVAGGAAFSALKGARRDHIRLAALTAAAAGALTLQRLARPLRQRPG